MPGGSLIKAGLLVVGLGILLVIAGSLLQDSGDVEGGAIVFIGPIPLVIGSSHRAALLSVVIGLLTLAVLIVHTR